MIYTGTIRSSYGVLERKGIAKQCSDSCDPEATLSTRTPDIKTASPDKGEQMPTDKDFKELLDAIANNRYMGMTILDRNGIVRFRNRVAEEMSWTENKDVLGKHFSVVPSKGELLEVLRTGKPKLGLTHLTRSGKKSIVHRFPLYSANEIIGAMSITGFKDATEMEIILRKYHLLKDKLEYYEKELQSFRSARYSFADI